MHFQKLQISPFGRDDNLHLRRDTRHWRRIKWEPKYVTWWSSEAGAGGVPAAIRAAQLGASVSIVEARDLGGQCMNRGCVPLGQMMEASGILGALKLGKGDGYFRFGGDQGLCRPHGSAGQLIDFMSKEWKARSERSASKSFGERTVSLAEEKSTSMAHPSPADPSFWPRVQSGAEFIPGRGPGRRRGQRFPAWGKEAAGQGPFVRPSPWLVENGQFLHRYGVRSSLQPRKKESSIQRIRPFRSGWQILEK